VLNDIAAMIGIDRSAESKVIHDRQLDNHQDEIRR